MRAELEKQYQIDILAGQAGGYFSPADRSLRTRIYFSACVSS